MNPIKILAIVLIAGGVVGLASHGFSYTKETHTADIGDLHIGVAEQKHVAIPMWAAIVSLAGGVLLLVTARKP